MTNTITEIPYNGFSTNYLPAGCKQPQEELSWAPEQQELVRNIRDNTASKRIFHSLVDRPQNALVFYSNHSKYLSNPFSGSSLAPDIIVVHEELGVLERLLDSPCLEPSYIQKWSSIAAVGEAKVDKDAKYQTANYLRHYLQLRPDLHSVIGFSADIHGYSLFYHDASVIHQSSKEEWTPGPLHAFIRQLYQGTPRDTSIITLMPMDLKPSWGIKIDDDIFVTISAKPDPVLGQRRFAALVQHVERGTLWFIKDIYRDDHRRFYEGILYDKAHSGKDLPGLMRADRHGYVLDINGNLFTTTKCGKGPNKCAPIPRSKMHMATQDVGRALSEARTLGEFLAVMYDACVVQRNLYRKCKILHRDISDNNIMIAPKGECLYKRGVYDEVKYLNQVLVSTEKPKPVIDLGNGADLEFESKDSEFLAERTGTPKLISRGLVLPKLEGKPFEIYTAVAGTEYDKYNQFLDQDPDFDTPKFTHRLFHDAESTFWVIAWFLARAAPKGYQVETEWNQGFRKFVNGMESHRPASDNPDGRSSLFPDPDNWKAILHPRLAHMITMLYEMHKYIFPEWGYRPDLDAEHAHEALMRLLLIEIVRIRDLPFPRPAKSKPRSSISNSLTTASSLSVPVNNKRSRSQEDDGTESDAGLRRTPRLAQLKLNDAREADQTTVDKLLGDARDHPWVQRSTWLKRPECSPSTNAPP